MEKDDDIIVFAMYDDPIKGVVVLRKDLPLAREIMDSNPIE